MMGAAEQGIPTDGRSLRADPHLIRAFLDAIVDPDDTFEIRVPKTRRGPARIFGTTAGYFTDVSNAVRAVLPITGLDAPAVYVTLNPVKADLRARANNRLVPSIAATTSDDDVTRRRHVLFDFDPRRPSETSATDTEQGHALAVRDTVAEFLSELGWPDPLATTMSGNGGGLIYRIDPPNDDASAALVSGCLAALAALFDSADVDIDQTEYNAARVTKLIGTVSAKGDDCSDLGRVWRLAKGTVRPEAGVVRRTLLEDLARRGCADVDHKVTARPGDPPIDAASSTGVRSWTVANILTGAGVGWHEEQRRYGLAYCLDRCLTSSDHSDGAAILEFPSGAPGLSLSS
jgi:hypothetical protein